MHLPRSQISQLYQELLRTTHPLSPPVLILTALTVDTLCATRLLTGLLKRDYIPHKVQPVSGYSDLQRAGQKLVLPLTRHRGGDGGVVVCLGVGGMVDLEEVLGLDGLESDEAGDGMTLSEHGVEVWVLDARRPWNLQNVFGAQHHTVAQRPSVEQGRLLPHYRAGKGGVIVWDDGDIQADLGAEKEAYMELQGMPDITEDDLALEDAESGDEGDEEPSSSQSRKRKASDEDSDLSEDGASDEGRPRQRRRSNSSTIVPSSPSAIRSGQLATSATPSNSQPPSPGAAIPSSPPKQPSQRQLRRKLLKLRRKHEATLERYYDQGTWTSEPVSSMLYSLASELGREDNDLLWLAIIGIQAVDLSPLSIRVQSSQPHSRRTLDRAEQIREVLRDEVRRLNPIPDIDLRRSQSDADVIPTHARSPTDTAIRLSPEPRFFLIRHWSLYDSMLHSPYLATRLHVWSDAGRKRLHKLLAKMGISLQEAGKGYVHMDMEIKRSLRKRILKFAEQYNLDGLAPSEDGRTGKEGWGFVRSWGWKATLSAIDVAIIVSAILEVGADTYGSMLQDSSRSNTTEKQRTYSHRIRALPSPPHSSDDGMPDAALASTEPPDWTTTRFFTAYDALSPSSHAGLSALLSHIPTAQHLSRAILRTGSALISKHQIRHLRAFRMGVVKEGPDVQTFVHPGALVKLAGWVSEAVSVLEAEKGVVRKGGKQDEALVLGCLDERRSVYVVVGLGGGGAGKRGVRSKAEIREREAKRKRKEAARVVKKAERARKREERRRLRRERDEANGILIDSDDDDHDSDATESTASTDASASSSSSDSDVGSESDSNPDHESQPRRRRRKGHGLNRFGQAFQSVVEETGARVRIDSFEHSVVEVKKEDLAGFLESLSLKSVVG